MRLASRLTHPSFFFSPLFFQLRLVRQIEMLPISETEKAVRKSELARSVHLPTFDFPDGSKRIGENIVGKCQ